MQARPGVEDALAAAAVFALGALLVAIGAVGSWSDSPRILSSDLPSAVYLVPLALGCAAMLGKRRWPIGMLLVGVAAAVLDYLVGGSVGIIVVLFDLVFSAVLYSAPARRRVLVRAIALLIVGVTVSSLVAGAPVTAVVLVGLQLVAVLAVPVWWALNVVQKSELAGLAEERAELERSRADAVERVAAAGREEAVRAERARMARDLHDTIAGQLSVIAIRASASLAHPPDAERDRTSLTVVRESALESLEEMRQLIGLLRDGSSDPWATAPGLERIEELVEGARRSGIEMALEWTGAGTVGASGAAGSTASAGSLPSGAAPAPTQAEQAVYRVVQEAIVNAGKHAPGAPVTVRITVGGDEGHRLAVEVVNPVRVDARSQGVTSGVAVAADLAGGSGASGLGLLTMRERTTALGGRFEAGRRATPRGAAGAEEWFVRAELVDRPGPPTTAEALSESGAAPGAALAPSLAPSLRPSTGAGTGRG